MPSGIQCDVIYSDPPAERTEFRRTKYGNLPVNDAKQLLSTIRGLEHMSALGISHSLKLRTDQWIDLVSISQAFNLYRSKIAFPLRLLDRQDHLNDFYFAGPNSELLIFCKAANETVAVKPNIHNNLFYAYARKKGLNLIFPLDFYSGSYKRPHSPTPLERHMWRKYFDVFPEAIYSNLVWRGQAASKPESRGVSTNANFSKQPLDSINCMRWSDQFWRKS